MTSSRGDPRAPTPTMQDYMINWNIGPLGLVLRPDLGADMPPVVAQVLPGESVASLAGVAVGDMLVSVNAKKTAKLGYDKAMRMLYKQKLPIILHFRIPQFKTMAAASAPPPPLPVPAPPATPHEYNHSVLHSQYTVPNHHHGGADALVAYNTSVNSQPSFTFDNQQRPGQYLQRQRLLSNGSELHNNHHPTTTSSSSSSSNRGGGGGGRSMSMLSSSALHETKEQKLKKQFSVVWESGSLGFSFRPYAPGVNIPTVDLIGARGKGKNMDQVCVNDVLIAINGDKTQHLGVERVLKMLHVLEKPVVLRFHKSSHRIDHPPPPPRRRRKSSVKLPAVEEQQAARAHQDQGQEQDEPPYHTSRRRGRYQENEEEVKQRQDEEDEDAQEEQDEEDDEDGVSVLQEEEEDAMPSVRFALDDQIQLRSDSTANGYKTQPPSSQQPVPTPTLGSSAASSARRTSRDMETRRHEAPPSIPTPPPVASHFASRTLPPPQHHQHQHQPTPAAGRHVPSPGPSHRHHSVDNAPVPRHGGAIPPAATTHTPIHQDTISAYEDIGPSISEPDLEGNDPASLDEEPEGPPVKISVAGSQTGKRAAPSFVIPLDHARQIVAKSSGKSVDECEFGGVRLMDIKEGSVQARLLTTFAKACLAKQMQQARGEDKGVVGTTARPVQPQPQQQQPLHVARMPQPYSSNDSHSSGRKSNLSSGRRSSYDTMPSQAPVTNATTTLEGNTLAPGRPKYLSYSFVQTQGARKSASAPPVRSNSTRSYLALPPSESGSMKTHPAHYNGDFDPTGSSVSRQVPPSSLHASASTITREHELDDVEEDLRPSNSERITEPFMSHESVPAESSGAIHSPHHPHHHRVSEPGRVSAGGLSLSQLRGSGKLTPQDVDEPKFKDLGDVIESEENSALPKRVTEMIALDTLLALRVDERAAKDPLAKLDDEEEKAAEQVATKSMEPAAEPDLSLSSSIEGDDRTTFTPTKQETRAVPVPAQQQPPNEQQQNQSPPKALPSHPVVQALCAASRDLEFVLVGHSAAMIVCKKQAIEEIQDILDSLEMELQFERHSHVGVGRGSMLLLDEPPARSCSRCGKRGDLADLALDTERRELYCHNCWEVFFYHAATATATGAPEFDSPTEFDPYEYSLHDSMVNVEGEAFHPWRHLHLDDQRDSNVTVGSSITEHADEVWL